MLHCMYKSGCYAICVIRPNSKVALKNNTNFAHWFKRRSNGTAIYEYCKAADGKDKDRM